MDDVTSGKKKYEEGFRASGWKWKDSQERRRPWVCDPDPGEPPDHFRSNLMLIWSGSGWWGWGWFKRGGGKWLVVTGKRPKILSFELIVDKLCSWSAWKLPNVKGESNGWLTCGLGVAQSKADQDTPPVSRTHTLLLSHGLTLFTLTLSLGLCHLLTLISLIVSPLVWYPCVCTGGSITSSVQGKRLWSWEVNTNFSASRVSSHLMNCLRAGNGFCMIRSHIIIFRPQTQKTSFVSKMGWFYFGNFHFAPFHHNHIRF